MGTLRSKVIRLAHARPEMRAHLLPLVAGSLWAPDEEEALPEVSGRPSLDDSTSAAKVFAFLVTIENEIQSSSEFASSGTGWEEDVLMHVARAKRILRTTYGGRILQRALSVNRRLAPRLKTFRNASAEGVPLELGQIPGREVVPHGASRQVEVVFALLFLANTWSLKNDDLSFEDQDQMREYQMLLGKAWHRMVKDHGRGLIQGTVALRNRIENVL